MLKVVFMLDGKMNVQEFQDYPTFFTTLKGFMLSLNLLEYAGALEVKVSFGE